MLTEVATNPRPTERGIRFKTGVPVWWENEATGNLQAAVRAIFDHPDGLTLRQTAALRDYFRIWLEGKHWEKVEQLRRRIDNLLTPEEILQWARDARRIGVDPL
jgi:hypothetical protein